MFILCLLNDGLGKGSLACGASVVLEALPQIHLTPAAEEAGTFLEPPPVLSVLGDALESHP